MDKTCARVSRVGASDFATFVTNALTNAAGHRSQSKASKHGNNPTIHSITRRSVYHPTESQTHTSTTHVAQSTDDLVARLLPLTSHLLTSTTPRRAELAAPVVLSPNTLRTCADTPPGQ